VSHPYAQHRTMASQLAPPGSGIEMVRKLTAIAVLEKFYEHPDSLKGLVGVIVHSVLDVHIDHREILSSLGDWLDPDLLGYDFPSGQGYITLGIRPTGLAFAIFGTTLAFAEPNPDRAKLETDLSGTQFRLTIYNEASA